MSLRSLRARFVLAYAGLIILGFGLLAMMAGQQLAASARKDYERQYANQALLVARGLEGLLLQNLGGALSDDDLQVILEDYEAQTGATITLFLFHAPTRTLPAQPIAPIPYDKTLALEAEWQQYPEIVSASRRHNTLERRRDENGVVSLYVAAPLMNPGNFFGYVQLKAPINHLNNAIYQRWAGLGMGVFIVTLIALGVSYWLSVSLIRPLGILRDSALQFSQGDFAHRVSDFSTSELNQVAASFNYMAQRVEGMLEEQRAFASNTSHELRTPLTTMRLRTEALRHDTTLDTETKEQYIQELDDEVVRLSALIEDLIILSRFDAGRAEVGKEQIDFLSFAETLIYQFKTKTTEKAIRFLLLPPDDLPDDLYVRANLNHLMVVFRNLLDNAVKYIRDDGLLTWSIRAEGENIVSVIEDNGQGITPEQLSRVFDRFYRADKAHSRHIPGTGLGLSLVKAIVETYGGAVEIHSAGLGQGTQVTVRWQRYMPVMGQARPDDEVI